MKSSRTCSLMDGVCRQRGAWRADQLLDLTLFVVLLGVLTIKALSDIDVIWDNLAYHLPFAALRSGIFGSEFSYGPYLNAVYEGFPPLHDILKGYLWKLTGNIN